MMMKKLISALILAALLLSSVLAIVPASAAGDSGRESIIVNSRDNQMAGEGPSFYYNYHLYAHEVGEYPINSVKRPDGGTGYQGTSAYMLRSRNAANGSASFMDGALDTYGGVYNDFSASDEKGSVTDKDGKTYDFDAWCGISIRETASVDGFAFYTLNEATKGSRDLIEEIMLFGAVVDPELHTYAPNSWFPLTELITDVQTNYTEDDQLAVVIGDFDKTFDIDYLFMAVNVAGDGGDFTIVEIELYEEDGVDINTLDTTVLKQTLALAEESLGNEKGFTADSFAALTKAYNSAKKIADKEKTNQAAIDRVATALYKAITALVPVADTSELDAELAKCETLVETDYTVSTWAAFVAARDAAKTLIETGNTSEAAISEHLAALKKAEEELAPRATAEEIAAVRAKIDEALAFESKVYTMTTFVALRSILSDINQELKKGDEDVSPAQCEAAIKSIDEGIAALKKRADIEALKAIVAEALTIDAKAYTKESYDNFTTAVNALSVFTTGLTDNATEEEGAALVAAIEEAKAALVKLGDLAPVTAKITELEKLVADEYTEESWKALTDAIAAAKALKADAATEADVASALAALEAAEKGLAKPAPTEPATDPVAEGGCGGVISVGAVVLVATLGFGITALKRR